ncbi:hypothetical protein [Nostoc sp.]|uniref:hypothetical protein n=1 Tax=Nostoc sp. TaxID=1180 RepID=UPI002FF55024
MTLLRRYRYANGSSSWGNPHRPWRLPFSQRERLAPREKTALPHHLKTLKSLFRNTFDF